MALKMALVAAAALAPRAVDSHTDWVPTAERAGSVRIQFCSDLHLEMPLEAGRLGLRVHQCLEERGELAQAGLADTMPEDARSSLPQAAGGGYLALLGDIFDGEKVRNGAYRDFLLRQSPGFEAVFVLAGNHEFYRAEYFTSRAALKALCEEVTQAMLGAPAVHFLDCGHIDLPGTALRVLGCTLWSEVDEQSAEAVARSLSDYSAISVSGGEMGGRRKASVADTNSWHTQERMWLEAAIAEAGALGRRCVVLTHHAPTFHGACPPQHRASPAAPGFCSSLERLLQPPVTAWLFGHTHWSSWQRYRTPSGDGAKAGSWATLSGGADRGGPHDEELRAPAALCRASAGEVLVASNQLGYGAKGERGTRWHPWMLLEVSADGGQATLRCGPPPPLAAVAESGAA